MATKKSNHFLVVFEDVYHNKESAVVPLGKIGTQIKKFLKEFNARAEDEINYDKYNSDNPYDVGTFGLGFYDIPLIDEDDEYCRIMIFML